MNYKLLYLTSIILLSSCARNIYDLNYKGESNYSNFYIVDTIKIIDPIRIHSNKFGGEFIISKSILKEYNDRIEFFYRPDVFILGTDLYRFLTPDKYSKYFYPDEGGCDFVKSSLDIKGLEIYEFKQSPRSFVLGLINANYYYVKSNSYVSFAYPEKNDKISYYKIVYPRCK